MGEKPRIHTLVSLRGRIKEAMSGVLRQGPISANRIALTFDGGPHGMTPQYLDTLDALGVPATFFLSGQHASPELVREYLRRGHQVASRGYDDTPFGELSRGELLAACRRTEDALGGQLTGRPWIRPPGALDARSLIALRTAGYLVSGWSIDADPDDDARAITERCARARAGDVVRLHEGRRSTLDALPSIVRPLLDRYECVTMHDLFAA